MSTTFRNAVIINDTLEVAASGAKTASFTGVEISNSATSTTASVDKIAARIESTGIWSGASARNYGLKIESASGGASNWNLWSGDTSGFSPAALEYIAVSQSVFAIKDGPNAPALFLAESDSGGSITSLNALAIATAGASDIIGLWGQAHNEDATLSTMASIQTALTVSGGSVGEAVQLWVNTIDNQGSITTLYGIRVDDQAGATNNFGIYTNQSADTNNYAIYNAGGAKSFFGGDLGLGTSSPGSRLDIADGAFTLAEMTAPAAPAANKCVIYAEDNGSGKTRLMVRFPTGSAVQLANRRR